ncbi:MAG: transcription elongation factor GreA [Saprospiraceae bacterium]|jgi:transcription elongation factor GreA|uniref:transcription elongation factor GreA n=1 Tax=Candidatus Brachybacter algidus TaxID=2982024 RepID=UPI001B7506CA|nr:transcription elongation factor GreA [Candidatus Brachybacter algidus]MBP7306560.1 transcription elongation factor GreA [Saprospiraceae bacterium]MBK6374184.1 transcription elongation factor GreA [Candidatus Brachybacter algidus]MBK6450008.1 transcription elongation factor GreA [Candidatus Brachybacter algidus]MBK7604117.1 transcription elongation factor GreA [Candidatus Brachybacter algidus]MBK8353885.1 transcription elongation factor GreA [Candidatus Brachybacter algidus]
MSNYNYLTQEGLDKLNAELEDFKTNGRQEAAKAIAEARDKGDLSENAEYDAAKNAQGMLELRINELEKVLSNARLIDASQLDITKVTILSVVELENIKTKKIFKYTIVSEAEADLKAGKISGSSPIGKGLLGKKEGEVAVITTPAGALEFKILKLSH